MSALLSRDEFRSRAPGRDGGRCVLCGQVAVDVHHILERRLFADGGYRLSNAASVCAHDHLLCELTVVGTDEVRRAAAIDVPLLAAGVADHHDKWGNAILADHSRRFGPLEGDEAMRRALTRSGAWALFFCGLAAGAQALPADVWPPARALFD